MSETVTMFARSCTDCDVQLLCNSESRLDENMRQHMRDEHGVQYTLPEPVCDCGCEPCERAKELSADG